MSPHIQNKKNSHVNYIEYWHTFFVHNVNQCKKKLESYILYE